jgi:LPS export ABC transporter permease LptF/LPS export ABC transporter permease LptG
MFRIVDRYLIREIALPLFLGLTVLTFILQIQPIQAQAEQFVARGLEWSLVANVLITLLPQALCVTIPMAVLLGILVGCGRLAADREFVAMQACGVSVTRLARPVLLVATLGTAATAYETIVALPDANQTYRELIFVTVASRVESAVRPRVFFQEFPNRVIYVREMPPEGGWRDVFLADTSRSGETSVYFAREGRIRLDRAKRLVQIELIDGTSHTTHAAHPDDHETSAFRSSYITIDPATVFKEPPSRGTREKTFPELRKEIAELTAQNRPAYDARFMIQQKLSLPAACPILALIGLALATSNRKDGRLGSFAVGMVVIFIYYVLLFGARSGAIGGRINPDWAPWTPNLVLGVGAVLLTVWRVRGGDRPLPFNLAGWIPGLRRTDVSPADGSATAAKPRRSRLMQVPTLRVPMLKLLDLYLLRSYLYIVLLGVLGLLGVFYISTFIDLMDKLFRGETTGAMLLRYFYFRTPQFIYFVIPMSVLVSTLVTVGLFTKSRELMVMRACGISLYRTAAPLLVVGVAFSAILAYMQERVLVSTNREADQLERTIRRWGPATTSFNRHWMVGTNGNLYHYDGFDQSANRFLGLQVYELDEQAWSLRAVTRADQVTYVVGQTEDGAQGNWLAQTGWKRELGPAATRKGQQPTVKFEPFTDRPLTLDAPSYFKADEPIADLMSYKQLRDYTTRLQASGANVVPQRVALQRKIAFPFVALIMTILAVPFAISTGHHGAMYGIGIGIALAIVYIVTMSVTGALGSGGVMPAILAAWAPNILFGAAALYGVLTVRT